MSTLDRTRDYATVYGITENGHAYSQDGKSFTIDGKEIILGGQEVEDVETESAKPTVKKTIKKVIEDAI